MKLSSAKRLRGRGAGKTGGGDFVSPVEAPNTLQSQSLAKSIEVVSEGPIKGLVDGQASIFFNDIPLQNPDGTFNFTNCVVDSRSGVPDQDPLPGFPEIETEYGVGLEVSSTAPIIRSITDALATAVRVTIRVNEFWQVDTATGDINPTTVDFAIDVAGVDGIWKSSNANMEWHVTPTPETVQTTGLSFTVTDQFIPATPPTSGARISHTFTLQAQYRAVGSGTWINMGAPVTITSFATAKSTITHSGHDQVTVWSWNPAKAKHTFVVENLTLDEYEMQVVQGVAGDKAIFRHVPLTITGKTVSPYEESFRIALPAGENPWQIRVSRVTPDDATLDKRRIIIWSRYTELIDAQVRYDNSALFGVTADAKSFGGQIPRRAFEIYGLLVKIPSNYDPITRVYTGIWDGTFVVDWTDNPAWVFYDLITNRRYGVGKYIKELQVSKFDLYEIAKYCDELVSDGAGNLEPRFTFNGVINTRAEAFQVLTLLAGSFRAMTYWASGLVIPVQDRPKEPIKIVTPANVENGFINYGNSSLKEEHTVALVSWNNPEENYKLDVAIVEDPDRIRKFGWREASVTAFGCTSKSQAIRQGLWVLDTEANESETAGWLASLDQADAMPGEVVLVADPSYMGVRHGGRIKEVTSPNIMKLDAAFNYTEGVTYNLITLLGDGVLFESPIVPTGPGSVDTIEVTTDFPAGNEPFPDGIWAITTDEAELRPFRIITVSESEKIKFNVQAIFYDETKFDRVDAGIISQGPSFSFIPTGPILPPSNVNATEFYYLTGETFYNGVTLSWTPPNDSRVLRYHLQVLPPGGVNFTGDYFTNDLFFDFRPAAVGVYSFRVQSLDAFNRSSAWTYLVNFELFGAESNIPDVENFKLQVLDRVINFTWDLITGVPFGYYQIRYSTLLTGATWNESFVIHDRISKVINLIQSPTAAGTFLIKAFSSDGMNESENPAVVICRSASLLELNVVETLTEDPTFTGSKTDVVYNSTLGGIHLTTTTTGGVVTTPAEGTYNFHAGIDLGDIYTSRITGLIEGYAANFNNDVDTFANVDTVPNWDGGTLPNWDVIIEVRYTDDNPAGSPTWSAWELFKVSDYTARAFQFRAHLIRPEEGCSPVITALSVTVDMPDRHVGGSDVACPTAGIRIDIVPPYKVLKASAIDIQNAATGDYYTITTKSNTGFNIRFFNSGGTAVARTFDWMTKGYGVEL